MAVPRSLSTQSVIGLGLLLLTVAAPDSANAHGFAGKRYFPATLTFDDPLTQDEFGFLYSAIPDVKNEDGDAVDTEALSVDYAKSITPGIALSIGTAYTRIKAPDGSSQHGFDNIELGAKILGHINEESESVWSYGLDIDLGGTSSHGIGETYSVYSPAFYFGKEPCSTTHPTCARWPSRVRLLWRCRNRAIRHAASTRRLRCNTACPIWSRS